MTKRRKILLGVGAVLFLLVLYLFAWPVPIEPIAWEAPVFIPDVWKTTGTLAIAERIELPSGHGPEDIEVDSEGRIYAGLDDGRILRWDAVDKEPVLFAETGGRPLGLDWDQNGRLLVVDASEGLLAIDGDGKIEVLSTECGEQPLRLPDDLAAAADGSIWFSEASQRFGLREWKHDFFESKPNGRLCVWEPATKEAREALGDMYFANGVAVDPGQEFVLVAESSRYRVLRVWIAGERTGEHDVIIDNLPGIPDGISTGSNGIFWIAIASPRARRSTGWPAHRGFANCCSGCPRSCTPRPSGRRGSSASTATARSYTTCSIRRGSGSGWSPVCKSAAVTSTSEASPITRGLGFRFPEEERSG